MQKIIKVLGVLFLSVFAFHASSDAEVRCPVCSSVALPIDQFKDDKSELSKNISVWNRSICSNRLYGEGSLICPNDWYAYSSFRKTWNLSSQDVNAFAGDLSLSISDFPIPEKADIRSRLVYSRKIDGVNIVESVACWFVTDHNYIKKMKRYCKVNNISLKIDLGRKGEKSYFSAKLLRHNKTVNPKP